MKARDIILAAALVHPACERAPRGVEREEAAPAHSAPKAPTDRAREPAEVKGQAHSPIATTPAPADPRVDEAPLPDFFAIDAAKPLRISWPLDVGHDEPGPQGRMCLRGRQGANEIQLPGEGGALYAFRVSKPGRYRTHLRVRWLDDGIGGVDCNNSWFAALDGRPPVVVGNENERTGWHWERGPAARLEAGVHWLRVELREDGVYCDRMAIVREGGGHSPSRLDGLALVEQAGFGGLRPPSDPDSPVREIEIAALRTRSLVIGRGHVNEITVLAACQGTGEFTGRVIVETPSARGVRVEGDARIRCDSASPFARTEFTLAFPGDAPRRIHRVTVKVLRDGAGECGGECVFKRTLSFLTPPAWAFLGAFPDPTSGQAGVARVSDARLQPLLGALARRVPPGRIAQVREALADVRAPRLPAGAGWRLVEDGSCYDELGSVDMFKVYGRRQNAFAYAVTWIRAETRLNHRSFMLQADDTASLWIGGRLIAAMPVRLPMEANRLWSSASLRQGLNPVVIKIAQGARYWGFRFDVIDWHWQGRRGDVIYGAEPSDWPREKGGTR